MTTTNGLHALNYQILIYLLITLTDLKTFPQLSPSLITMATNVLFSIFHSCQTLKKHNELKPLMSYIYELIK